MIYVQVSSAVKFAMKQATERYIRNTLGSSLLIPSASSTPTLDDKTVGKWKIVGVAGRGSSTIMAAALHAESGTLAVVRHKQESDDGYDRFIEELRTEKSTTGRLSSYRFGGHHIQRFRECVYYPASGEMFAFYEPLCASDLATVLSTEDYTDLERQILFTQLMLAIQDLHAISRVHSDIKTKNICVRSRAPLCAVLIDTASIRECGSSELKCKPGVGGTVGYLAPEQEAGTTFGRPVDVWAAGCVGVQLLLRERDFTTKYLQVQNPQGIACNPWRPHSSYKSTAPPMAEDVEVTKRKFRKFRAALGECARSSKEYLLYRMLDPEPTKRIAAAGTTRHEFLRSEIERSSEASSSSVPGAKRTRSNLLKADMATAKAPQ